MNDPEAALLRTREPRGADAARDAPPKPLPPEQARAIFIGLMLAVFLAALNQTIVATALPTIGRAFHNFEELSWVVTAFLLTSTAVAPLYGKLSDIYGRRATMHASIGIFLAGSVMCALAPDMLVLILGRAVQGLGGGGILPVAQAIMADSITPRERGRYQAYMGVVWITSGVAGPVLGGVLAEHLHWSLVFWINVPLALAGLWMIHTRLRLLPRYDRRHRLDIFGAVLMMAACVPLLLALSWGGARFSWLSMQVLGLIAASGLFSFAFALRLANAPEPFLPLAVLKNPVMRMGSAANSFSMAAAIGLLIYLPLYFELVHGMSASESGFALIPLALTTPGSLMSGRAMMYMKHYKRVPAIGLSCGVLALAALAWAPGMPLSAVIVLLSIVGTSTGTCFPICTVSIQNAVPNHQVGVAMGAMNFFRALTSALAVAAMGAIVLAGFGAAPQRGMGSAAVVAAVSAAGGDLSYVFRWVFVAGFVFLLLALITLLLMEERPLRGRGEDVPAV
jgi:EmrB/QacA subfamily drug resistance transporter